ncbi:MAG TPA: leucyl aminopeptidase [candidate division Zixibacteria bacterium]|nr:leucyl aminopeptidase [candidate division Zixibacteria bacterium]
MEVRFRDSRPESLRTELLVLPVAEKKTDQPEIRALDRRLKGHLRERIEKSRFSGADGSSLLYSTAGLLPASHLLLLGIGPEREIGTDTWRAAGARASKEASAVGASEVAFFFPPATGLEEGAGAVTEGALLASYQFNKYRSNSKPAAPLKVLTLLRPGLRRTAGLEKAVAFAREAAAGVFLARDLVNEPPSVTTARFLAEQARRHCRGNGLSVEIWGKRKIEAERLAGLLAVNRGSQEEPKFIIVRYRPETPARKRVALIGKGITFDSGGLSLKPAKSMETMKLDMSGGAAVIAAMSRLPALRPPVEVTGYIPATDNLPGGNAQKPGDVIRYLNGKTIEVLNTDAEGRLILADALAYAARQKPDYMINLATLTGACMVALGSEVAGLFSNHQPLADRVIRCARESGEKLWQLPLVKEYREAIKSSVADMKNVGGSHGGAIIAALILQEFVADIPWAHLDIAGPAFAERDTPLCPKGGTGFGVRTLLRFLTTI